MVKVKIADSRAHRKYNIEKGLQRHYARLDIRMWLVLLIYTHLRWGERVYNKLERNPFKDGSRRIFDNITLHNITISLSTPEKPKMFLFRMKEHNTKRQTVENMLAKVYPLQ